MLLNAYYFGTQVYTVVPRHVHDDMAWMADCGTRALTLAILEQDLYASRKNIDLICRKAEKVGIEVWAVPSRWGGMVAGAPKVPSLFTVTHPETWILREDGTPLLSGISGAISSVHHPATVEFFRKGLTALLTQWPIRGIVFDEPKTLHTKDYSPAAKALIGDNGAIDRYTDAVADFIDAMGSHAKSVRAGTAITVFLYSPITGYALDRCARIGSMDYFGCDGRPWRLEDGGILEAKGKVLLGRAEEFIATAKKNGKKSMVLIENHNLPDINDYALVDRRMPEVLALGADQLVYYYYPRNLADPDKLMEIMQRHLKSIRHDAG